MNTLIGWVADYALVVLAVAAAVSWLRSPRTDKLPYAATTVLALGLVAVMVKAAGAVWTDPRPFVVDHVAPLISHSVDNGFPSDHTALAAAVATVVFFRHRRLGIGLLALTVVLGASRVFALVHHWPDIIGGLAIGVAAGAAAHLLIARLWPEPRSRGVDLGRFEGTQSGPNRPLDP